MENEISKPQSTDATKGGTTGIRLEGSELLLSADNTTLIEEIKILIRKLWD